MRFGLSTFLFHDERLRRDHLTDLAARGFEAIEVFATRTHFDYHDASAVDALADWLAETGLRLHSVHAPIAESYAGGVWGTALSIAAADREHRGRAISEAEAALAVARTIPFDFLVVHVGTPEEYAAGTQDNSAEAARRSVGELHGAASRLGVRLALEVIPNRLSSVEALRRLLDEDLELRDAGLCLDFGHAHLMDDVVSVVEEASGHMVTTHVHDNHGRRDDHLVPFDGNIDWNHVLFAAQKIGYDGVYVFELASSGSTGDVLDRAGRACRRFEEIVTA